MILKKFDQKTARLIPNIIEMESELELSTYTISEWELIHFEDGKKWVHSIRFGKSLEGSQAEAKLMNPSQ